MTFRNYVMRFAAFASLSVFALAEPTPPGRPLSDELSALLPRDCHHTGMFTQTRRVEGLSRVLNSSGAFVFSCEHGLIWSTREPVSETLIYRHDNRHYQLLGDEITELRGPLHRELGAILTRLIGGDTAYIRQHFALELITETPLAIQLKPLKKRLQKRLAFIGLEARDAGMRITLGTADATVLDLDQLRALESLDSKTCISLLPHLEQACASLLGS